MYTLREKISGQWVILAYGRYHEMWPRGRSADEEEIHEWCIAHFGEPGAGDPGVFFDRERWYQASDANYFRDVNDAIEFKMRWC